MAWVPDSRTAGYIGPTSTPPLYDDAFDDFLGAVIGGITNIPPTLVRPRWVEEPANTPEFGTDWCAFGVTTQSADWQPAVAHSPDADGHDVLTRHEVDRMTVTFYGPSAHANAAILRDGLFIDQNQAVFRAAAMAVVEVGPMTKSPELLRDNRWINRVDLDVTIRRQILRDYPVLNLLRATGTITADRGVDTIETEFDTGVVTP